MHNIERGRAPLTVDEARRLRSILEEDEEGFVRESGLSRTPIYRAAAEQAIQSATRFAIRMALARRQ
jgi:hypothetical protein